MLRTQSIEECQALVPTRSAAGTPPANTWCRAAVTTAPWLAEYLHELTVFPKGKHDLAAACLQEQDAFSPPAGGSDERTGREIGTRLCPRSSRSRISPKSFNVGIDPPSARNVIEEIQKVDEFLQLEGGAKPHPPGSRPGCGYGFDGEGVPDYTLYINTLEIIRDINRSIYP